MIKMEMPSGRLLSLPSSHRIWQGFALQPLGPTYVSADKIGPRENFIQYGDAQRSRQQA
jgi:hypothetical protein